MNLYLQLPLPVGESAPVSGTARLVFLQNDLSGESLAIAVVGQYEEGTAFGRVVTSKVLKCLPQELGYACHSFGALVVADYLAWEKTGKGMTAWKAPLSGIGLGKPFFVDAENNENLVITALERCALFRRTDGGSLSKEAADVGPRPTFEARFAQSVQREVVAQMPSLGAGFNRTFSLTSSSSGFSIDYIGHTYATCYAAIDPKSKTLIRLRAASAALWRLARARDAFGFATPERIELTAWVPAPGLPIYSDREYIIVQETIDELREQAKRENLDVVPTFDVHSASERLLSEETIALN